MAKRLIKLVGTERQDAKIRELRAGPLSAVLDNGAVRYIRYRDVEVLRAIAYLIRDKNWGTYSPEITKLKIRSTPKSFKVTYSAVCKDKEQAISYEAAIEGTANGILKFSATATPAVDFVTNRCGFVVLHPLETTVGKPVEVTHTDGARQKRSFPKLISPGQPVFEIRALKHEVVPGLTATVLMEGNKFEMEDHRNWMDASFKTYVCSLLDPWPYTLERGQPFTQSITLTVAGTTKSSGKTRAGKPVEVAVAPGSKSMPSLGAGIPMAEAGHAVEQSGLLISAALGHLVGQIDGREGGQAKAAEHYRALREATGIPFHLEIILPAKDSAEAELTAIADEVARAGLKPDAVIVTQAWDLKSFQPNTPRPPGPDFTDMAAAARKLFPQAKVGGGMLSYFTELNRKRPPAELFDFVTHSVCPIVHAADDISVMETLESVPSIVRSTRAIIGKTPYHVGPSSIGCRANPYGAGPAANPGDARVCLAAVDPRQRGLFAAAWTAGLIAGFAAGGVAALAAGAAIGDTGMIYRQLPHPQPGYEGVKGASVYPIYHLLAGLPGAGARRLETRSTEPARVAAVACRTKSGAGLWLANLTAGTRRVKISGFASGMVRILDEGSFDAAIKDPDWLNKTGDRLGRSNTVELGAYAVARILAA